MYGAGMEDTKKPPDYQGVSLFYVARRGLIRPFQGITQTRVNIDKPLVKLSIKGTFKHHYRQSEIRIEKCT